MTASSDRDSSSALVSAARKAPYLEREEERVLAIKWHTEQDQNALHRLTSSHLRLVIAIASRFRNYGLPLADLIQEGNVGLLEASARFDPFRDIRFSTYATWWIRASIQDYVLRNWSIVRGGTSSGQKSLFFNLRRLRAKISRQQDPRSGQELYIELAQAIGVSVKDVAVMDARLGGPDVSLNEPISHDGEAVSQRQDFLKCDAPLPDAAVAAIIDTERRDQWIDTALNALDDRELKIVKRRRLSDDGATLEELGSEMGVSKERIRQLESRALEKLKCELLELAPEIHGN